MVHDIRRYITLCEELILSEGRILDYPRWWLSQYYETFGYRFPKNRQQEVVLYMKKHVAKVMRAWRDQRSNEQTAQAVVTFLDHRYGDRASVHQFVADNPDMFGAAGEKPLGAEAIGSIFGVWSIDLSRTDMSTAKYADEREAEKTAA